MALKARMFHKEKDAHWIRKWMVNRGMDVKLVDFQFMPPTGIVVEMDSMPVAIGFMIKCDNGMVVNSDLISDPHVAKEYRQEAVEFLRETLYAAAKAGGYKLVTVFTKHPRLQKRLEEKGYFKVDETLTQLGRIL